MTLRVPGSVLFIAAVSALAFGCELIAGVDRGEIPVDATSSTGSGGSGASQAGPGGSGGVGGTGAVGGGGSGGCSLPEECRQPTRECQGATCIEGVCGEETLTGGEETPTGQTASDCKKRVCGVGGIDFLPDPSDPFDDGIECTVDSCAGVEPSNVFSLPGVLCSQDGGTVCDGAGACVECVDETTCDVGEFCTAANTCAPTTCDDDVQNGDETDIDCGGNCGATCDTDDTCIDAGDCLSAMCVGNVCLAPACDDEVQNGDETGTDCGGPTCPGKCGPNQGCVDDGDCTGGDCSGSLCLPTCTDQVENNGETDLDCGGPNCPDCSEGDECDTPADCTSGGCCGTPSVCDACCNGAMDGTETDVDCGGGTCDGCPDGGDCGTGTDCQSNLCVGGECLATTCDNAVLDPDESDVDCGGVCAPCGNGLDCDSGADCTSTICVDGVCCGTACIGVCVACSAVKKGGGADGVCGNVANDSDPDGECIAAPASTCGLDGFCNGGGACGQHESGTVCGAAICSAGSASAIDACNGTGTCVQGATTPCAPYVCGATACTTTCAGAGDCAAGNYCAAPTCLPEKADGAACGGDVECQSGVCGANVCRPLHCGDGDLDAGTESDIDCGLACGPTCAAGDDCTVAGDCAAPLTCGVGLVCE